MSSIPPLFHFYQFNQLKYLFRKGWIEHGVSKEQCESVADHTASMGFLVLLLADNFPKTVNMEKILKMIILHDLAEWKIGDITPSQPKKYIAKEQHEIKVIKEMFTKLNLGEEYIALFNEFEQNITQESQIVRILDKLEMGLQAKFYEQQFPSLNFHDFHSDPLLEKLEIDGQISLKIQDIIAWIKLLGIKDDKIKEI